MEQYHIIGFFVFVLLFVGVMSIFYDPIPEACAYAIRWEKPVPEVCMQYTKPK